MNYMLKDKHIDISQTFCPLTINISQYSYVELLFKSRSKSGQDHKCWYLFRKQICSQGMRMCNIKGLGLKDQILYTTFRVVACKHTSTLSDKINVYLGH